jgi:hypothetical protein
MKQVLVSLLAVLALLLCSCCLPTAAALKFLVVPIPGTNSPVLDIMSVAAQLQSRCVWQQAALHTASNLFLLLLHSQPGMTCCILLWVHTA